MQQLKAQLVAAQAAQEATTAALTSAVHDGVLPMEYAITILADIRARLDPAQQGPRCTCGGQAPFASTRHDLDCQVYAAQQEPATSAEGKHSISAVDEES